MDQKIIPFSKPYIKKEEINRVVDVLKSGWLTMGPLVHQFEKYFSQHFGGKAIAVSSCTAGLHLSLLSIGISNGDEVITSPFTFASTANTIVHCGAKPVFVDIEEDTYNIDPNKIEEKITIKTKAIVVVHYAGHPCDMDRIINICKKYNLKLIEDCAHALGAQYFGKHVGLFGDTGVFSFYVTKNITTGEGGMVITSSDLIEDKIKILRLHGMNKDAWKRYDATGSWYYEILEAGFKYNMMDIQAAIGIEQIKKFDYLQKKRTKIANYYSARLKKYSDFLKLPSIKNEIVHAWHIYPIVIKNNLLLNRNELFQKLKEKGIQCSVHFIPLHLQPFYQKRFFYKYGDFPCAEKVYENILSLPLYPSMKISDIKFIVSELEQIFNNKKK